MKKTKSQKIEEANNENWRKQNGENWLKTKICLKKWKIKITSKIKEKMAKNRLTNG